MKLMIASDIHGSFFCCNKLVERFAAEKAQRLLLLGDILYHGARNSLPDEYDTKKVASLLNSIKNQIICVRGNCDSEVDAMVLDFPIQSPFTTILTSGNKIISATHGHIYNKDNLPPLGCGDVLLYGHTHIPECTESEGIICLNPGSVSIPKGGSQRGYMTFEDDLFLWKNLDGDVIKDYKLK